MKVKRRYGSTKLGPLRFNRSGLSLTSITMKLPLGHKLELWKRSR